MLGMVGFGFDAEDCSVDALELLGECQLNEEWVYVGAWGANGVESAASVIETKDYQVRDRVVGVEDERVGFGCELVSSSFSFSVIHVHVKGWTVGGLVICLHRRRQRP